MRGCLSFVNVVCSQVEITATGRSLLQRSPNLCVCVIEFHKVQKNSSRHRMRKMKWSDLNKILREP